jgi:hypothetical protein
MIFKIELSITSNYCWGQEYVDLYSHSPIRLHGVVLNLLSTGTTLHFYHVPLSMMNCLLFRNVGLLRSKPLHNYVDWGCSERTSWFARERLWCWNNPRSKLPKIQFQMAQGTWHKCQSSCIHSQSSLSEQLKHHHHQGVVGLRHALSSLARKFSVFVCVRAFFCVCVQVEALRRAAHPPKESYRLSKN